MEWSKEQSRAINKRNSNILISAAAGSGKTTVLVERIRRIVIGDDENPPVPVDRILVLTYTKAAASEMRQKIIDSITSELEKEDSEYLRSQLRLVHTANISTFHSFEISILKKYYFILDMDPVFNICDDIKKDFLINEAMDLLFEEYFEADEQDEEFVSFLRKYATIKNEISVREMVLKTYDFIQSLPNPFEWLDEKTEALSVTLDEFVESSAFSEIIEEIVLDIEEAQTKMDNLYEDTSSFIPIFAEKLNMDAEKLENILISAKESTGTMEVFNNLKAGINEMKFETSRATKAEEEDYKEVSAKIKAIKESVKKKIGKLKNDVFSKPLEDYVKEINETYSSAKVLRQLVIRFHEILSELKRRDGVIDYSDMDHYALKILEDERVRAEYQAKFDHIFVDEYQDTNYIQEELINRIKSEKNLFMVGDVKQSIYQFRQAEPKIFVDKYKSFSDDENAVNYRINLNKNFRSKAPIISDINGIFTGLMKERIAGIDYDDSSALHLGLDYNKLEYDGGLDKQMEVYFIEEATEEKAPSTDGDSEENVASEENKVSEKKNDSEGNKASEKKNDSDNLELLDENLLELKGAELEATVAAKLIKETISENGKYFDAASGEEKQYDYRDIVVLLREAKTSGQIWYDTLQSHGIPAFVSSGEGYFNTIEIETFMNLLRLIDNTCQDVPLVGTMYSPVFGFSIDELVKIRLAFPKGAFYKALLSYVKTDDSPEICENLREKCVKMLDRLDDWRKREMFMELSDFLWTLLKESGYYDYAGALPAGTQRRANLVALIDKGRDYRSKNSRGLFGFIRFIERIKNNKLQVGQVKMFSEGDNAVRIMTIHKSKGLEYPMVIVGQQFKTKKNNSDSGKVKLHREIGIGLQWEDPSSHTCKKTLFQKMIDYKKTFEGKADELRTYYVALTRAKERLIILGASKGATNLYDSLDKLDSILDVDVMGSGTYFKMIAPLLSNTNAVLNLVTADEMRLSIADDFTGENVAEKLIENLDSNKKSDSFEEIDRRLSYEYPASASQNVKSKYSVSEINKAMKAEDEDSRVIFFFEGSEEESIDDAGLISLDAETMKLSAAVKGTALHVAFERMDYKEAFENRDDIDFFKKYISGLEADKMLTSELASSIDPSQIMKYANSPIFEKVMNASEVYRETPFVFRYNYKGEEVLVQGIIDLWFIYEGRIILLDFKSGRFAEGDPDDEARLINTYKGQINIYREALEKIISAPVDDAYLYLTKTSTTIKIDR